MREEQKAKGIIAAKYDKLCLKLSKEDVQKNLESGLSYVIRLNVLPDKTISFHDVVFGDISVSSNDIDDQILLKSDGFPTYHLGVVVDDHLMEITHIMRGNDWIPSTPKHIILYDAFGWELPVFAHLPNLKELGADKKLSKRFGPVSASEFLDDGYLPEALNNFLMFLGWNPGTDKEIYSLDEFVKDFDIHKIHKTDLVAFDRQKLDWMNGNYIQNMPTDSLLKRLQTFYKDDKEVETVLERSTSSAFLELAKTRMKKLKEFKDLVVWVHAELSPEEKEVASVFRQKLGAITDWNKDAILNVVREVIKEKKIKGSMLYKVTTGYEHGLPLPESLEILGKEATLERLQ